MEIDFVKLMSAKSDEALNDYIINSQKFNSNAVQAAIEELRKRGRIFSAEELERIENDLKTEEEIRKNRIIEDNHNWEKNIVTDFSAPVYYSQLSIYSFSIFFSVIFGSILLAINASKTEAKAKAWVIIVFGFLYTALEIFALEYLPTSTPITIAINGIGAYILNNYFWKKYLGKDVKYQKKSILIPLMVGIGIIIIFLLFLFYTGQR